MRDSSFEQIFEPFFRPETRSAGRRFLHKQVVFLASLSDLEVAGVVRAGMTPVRVQIKTRSFEDPVLRASCLCPSATKGQLCRHVWAVLEKIHQDRPDFLLDKNSVECAGAAVGKTKVTAPKREIPDNFRQQVRERQKAYRQAQSAKQKAWKEQKNPKRPSRFAAPERPADVQQALDYFNLNGFPIGEPLQSHEVASVKKKLSRLFHPDRGGTTEEFTELTEYCQTLIDFISKNS